MPNTVVSMMGTFNECTNLYSTIAVPAAAANNGVTWANCPVTVANNRLFYYSNWLELSGDLNNWYAANITNGNKIGKMHGAVIVLDNVTNLYNAFAGCNNKNVIPIIKNINEVTNMASTFASTYNLIMARPITGSNVTNMYRTYLDCYRLKGSPVCGPNVSNMTYTYS